MIHLLNLLAAIALLVWGTHIVRTGVLRVFGENLRGVLARSFRNRFRSLVAGLGVTSIVQPSTATCLIVASFVGKGRLTTAAALAVMLGAGVGTSPTAVVFPFDLSWLSPLLIFVGVVMFVARQNSGGGRIGRVLIGLGLITLALQLIVGATRPLTESPAVRALLVALPNDILFDIVVGTALTVLSYSSLAIVLLTATLASSGLLPTPVALGLVLGANLGSGLLAMLFISLTGLVGGTVDRWLQEPRAGSGTERLRRLDPSALATMLRRWKDLAKQPNLPTPSLAHFLDRARSGVLVPANA